ncbi:MAG: pyridoxal phosphate-dependent aminotransferase [Bacteroidota bacterium]
MSVATISPVSERIHNMAESATLKMSQLGRELKAKGHDVISLSLGEPDFDTPDHIKEAAKQALNDGYTKYTPVPGLLELREAICTKFKRDNSLEFTPNQVVVSTGAKQSLANLCQVLLNEGDEAIIFSPYWVTYSEIVRLAGGVPVDVFAGIENDYKVTAEQVEAAITDKTKIVLFSSPCNPTGSVYLEHELEAIANALGKHEGIYVVADEIYEYINFVGKHSSIGTFDAIKDRTITVNGFAKGFAMTGWRLGYIGAPLEIAKACAKHQGQVTSGANAFAQKAAAYALLADMTPTHEMRKEFLKRRDMVLGLLREIPGLKVNEPEGAFYVFPDISNFMGKSFNGKTIENSEDFCIYMLNEAHVALVPGGAFGAEGYFRMSYAASEAQLREAIERIKKAIAQLS